MSIPLKNKICVVTGSSQGIGKAIALSLAKEGCQLYLLGRHKDSLQRVADEARSYTQKVQMFQMDLRDMTSIQDFVNYLQTSADHVDILINCAGAFDYGPWREMSESTFDRLFETNVKGTFLLTRELLPFFSNYPGQIVFINSTLGIKTNPFAGAYAASKHALKAFTDSLRGEVNHLGIKVMSIFPGRTNTPMAAYIFEAENKSYDPEKLLQPEDIAEMLIHILRLSDTAEITDLYIRPFYKSY